MLSYLNPLPQLPKYKGPFKVGSCEYEIPVLEIPSATAVPDSTISTIKFRVFYPTTAEASSKTSIPWLPNPQKEWNRAYATFLGFSDRSCNVVANIPSMLNHPTLPAVHNAPLSAQLQQSPFPVTVFSHGLGGNYNAYSSFVGSLASCGAVVFVPEHRDQSAPITFIKSSHDVSPGRPVLYRKVSHSPRVEVLNARNQMLRVRLWELEKLYSVVQAMNIGRSFTNYAASAEDTLPSFRGQLDLDVGRVTWAGHSFGAASIVQFVKSVYYRQHAPKESIPKGSAEEHDWTPLYTPAENDELSKQITLTSPMVLLDLWTMPLTSKTTRWLWEKPLPCYDRQPTSAGTGVSPNVVSIMSQQFYKWSEMLNRTKALLSANPAQAYQRLTSRSGEADQKALQEADANEPSPQLTLDPITRLETSKTRGLQATQDQVVSSAEHTIFSPRATDSSDSEASTRTSSPAPTDTPVSDVSASSSLASLHSTPGATAKPETMSSMSSIEPLLYLVPTSAHLSQSDFGLLFPNVTKWLLKTIEPQTIMDLNVRAASAMMRSCGLNVAPLNMNARSTSTKSKTSNLAKKSQANSTILAEDQDLILQGHGELCSQDIWQRISI